MQLQTHFPTADVPWASAIVRLYFSRKISMPIYIQNESNCVLLDTNNADVLVCLTSLILSCKYAPGQPSVHISCINAQVHAYSCQCCNSDLLSRILSLFWIHRHVLKQPSCEDCKCLPTHLLLWTLHSEHSTAPPVLTTFCNAIHASRQWRGVVGEFRDQQGGEILK